MASKKNDTDPAEQLLEFLLYAPVGLALEAVDNLPKYVERGKSQVTIGRFLAKTAAKKGSSTIESASEKVINDLGKVFVDFFGIDLTPDSDDEAALGDAVVEGAARIDPADEHLPIDEYDSQAAAQIVKLLVQLTPDELEAIEAYELENRNRVTILRKIAQLRTAA